MDAVTTAEELRIKQWVESFRTTERGAPFGVSPSSAETTTTATKGPTFNPSLHTKLGNAVTLDQLDRVPLLEARDFEETFGLKLDDFYPGQQAGQVAFERTMSGGIRELLNELSLRARSIIVLEIVGAALEAESP